MSAITGGLGNATTPPRPSLFRLAAAVLAGEILAAVGLWIVVGFVFGLLALAPVGGAEEVWWLPWRIDGAWALVGAIGWAYLVCALVARLVGDAIARRGLQRPAAGWLQIAIAVSGYGAMAVGHTAGAHVFGAVVAGAVLVRLVAFNLDGSVRSWPWAAGRRLRVATMLLALLVGLSYSVTHAFAADGTGGTYASGAITARVGHTDLVDVGLSHMDLPVTITAVSFSGPGASHVRSSGLLLSGNVAETLITPRLRSYPGARRWPNFAWSPTRLPYRIPAGRAIWLSASIRLSSCADVTINTLRLRYTVLGIATGETIPLQSPLTLSCRR